MKFFNGRWETAEGISVYSPEQIYEYRAEDNKLILLMPTWKVSSRGATLGGVTLTVEVSVLAEGMLRIRAVHYKGEKKRKPEFPILCKGRKIDFQVKSNTIEIYSGEASLKIDIENGEFVFYHGDKVTAKIKKDDLSYIKTQDKGLLYEEHNGQAYMRGAVHLAVGECIYGLGERFGALVKNGQSIDMWNEDGGTCSELSYKNVPFFVSNRGYGIFVNHPEKVSFEIGSELVKKAAFSVPGEVLDFFYFHGPSMKEVIQRYTLLTGRPACPPDWSFGLWLSTSFTTDYDENTVTSFIDGMKKRGIPLSVFHFDCFWMKGFHWTDFTWDEGVFPDPSGMLMRLKERGLHICVWINPYIAQASSAFEEGMENGYFLRHKNGNVWQWDMWQSGMAIVDFTNPAARKWFGKKLEQLIDLGVDCFKTDFGERIPTEDIVWFDGSDPQKMHNYYSYLYNETVYEILKKKKGEEDALVFARSATAGGQRFPVHWGGDCWSDYESMAESLRGGLSLTMSGFGYWSHDIGGFEDTSTPDVYKRWVAFGLLSTHSRLHGSWSYRVPWAYDEEAVAVLRHFVKVKQELMPYLLEQARKNHETGIPVMRAMVLEFPDDPNCTYLDKQYMLGDDYLVAPVFNPDGMAHYYLPEGKWQNYFTGQTIGGGKWVKEYVDYFTIPMFLRLCL